MILLRPTRIYYTIESQLRRRWISDTYESAWACTDELGLYVAQILRVFYRRGDADISEKKDHAPNDSKLGFMVKTLLLHRRVREVLNL